MFPSNYTGPIYGNNVIGLRANSPAVQAPNYSKASKYLKKWLEARPHEIRLNQVLVKLPPNASDPITLNHFNKGNEAIMVLKKDVRNGKLRTKRYFLSKNSLSSIRKKYLTQVKHMNENTASSKSAWRFILRMKASDFVIPDPLDRRTVRRRNLINVKFV
jgi:hypothetical protein